MRLFAIADTHLPSARKKDMHRFGWHEHPGPLQRAWDEKVTADDAIIVAGDISWATRPHEALEDFAWLDARPGKKVLVKGNHDFWWQDSMTKLREFLNAYPSIVGAIHNCAVVLGPYVIAGSRLWTAPQAPQMPGGEMGDEKANDEYVKREANRLSISLRDAEAKLKASPQLTKVVAVHFPPVYSNGLDTPFSGLIEAFAPQVCVYGHLHGPGISAGFVGERNKVRYVLASCDAAQFSPVQLL